jgi:hypothetical protein
MEVQPLYPLNFDMYSGEADHIILASPAVLLAPLGIVAIFPA